MKVLIFNPLVAVWRPRLPAILTVIQQSIDQGDDVVVIGCERDVPACTATLEHNKTICRYCTARWDKGLQQIDGNYSLKTIGDYIPAPTYQQLLSSYDSIDDLDDLRSLHFDGADVGYAAWSSYSYVARNPKPDLDNPDVAKVIQNLVNTGKLVFTAMTAAIKAEAPDRVVIYHGRGAIDRAALRACQTAGVDCYVYETALEINKLIYFKNALPQDIQYFAQDVAQFWAKGPQDKAEIGGSFFEMRRSGATAGNTRDATVATQDRVYINGQAAGSLPPGWNDEQKNVVIFGTSDDEFVAINPEYEITVYPSQLQAAKSISQSIGDAPAIHLYFRMHPRQKGVDNDYVQDLMDLAERRANLTVIPPDSEISSYTLLDRADIVLAFRSTMSMEAVYAGKPCIVLANSIFKPLGATYNPKDHDEVVELIRSDLLPKDKTPALKMGYYRMRSGFTHPYFEADISKGSDGYSFKGNQIRIGGISRFSYILARERQRQKWRSI